MQYGALVAAQMRGEWFDAVSCCVTFSRASMPIRSSTCYAATRLCIDACADILRPQETMRFRHAIVRLHPSPLQRLAAEKKFVGLRLHGSGLMSLCHGSALEEIGGTLICPFASRKEAGRAGWPRLEMRDAGCGWVKAMRRRRWRLLRNDRCLAKKLTDFLHLIKPMLAMSGVTQTSPLPKNFLLLPVKQTKDSHGLATRTLQHLTDCAEASLLSFGGLL